MDLLQGLRKRRSGRNILTVEAAQTVSEPRPFAQGRFELLIHGRELVVQEVGKAAGAAFIGLPRTLGEVGLEKPAPLADQPIVVQGHDDRNPALSCFSNTGGREVHKVMKMDDVRDAGVEKGPEAPGNFCIDIALRKALQVVEGIIDPRDRDTVADSDVYRVLGLGWVSGPREDLHFVAPACQCVSQVSNIGLRPSQALRR